ncbi:MAG: hypothetical protein ACP5M4_07545 [Acidobacteriaceae bacterium]
MKKLALFVFILLFAGAAVSAFAQRYDQDDHDGGYGQRYDRRNGGPRDGACFYMTAPFRGQSFCMRAGDRMPSLPKNYDDNISSMEVFGDVRVLIFNDSDYRDGSAEVWRTIPDLRDLPFRDGHTWNNRISSIMVLPGGEASFRYGQPYPGDNQDRGYGDNQGYSGQYGPPDSRPSSRDGACFYMTAPFRGKSFCMRAGERMPHLPEAYDNNISSIEVFGNARVRIFNDSDFRNGSAEVWQTIPDLRDLPFRDGHTWNNRISSIIVY